MPGSWPWSRSPSPPRAVVSTAPPFQVVIDAPREIIEDSRPPPMPLYRGVDREVDPHEVYQYVTKSGLCYLNLFHPQERDTMEAHGGPILSLEDLFFHGERRRMTKYAFAATWQRYKTNQYLIHLEPVVKDDWRYIVRGRFYREDLLHICSEVFPGVPPYDIYIGGKSRQRQKPAAQAQNQVSSVLTLKNPPKSFAQQWTEQPDFEVCRCQVHRQPISGPRSGCSGASPGNHPVIKAAFEGRKDMCHAEPGTRRADHALLRLALFGTTDVPAYKTGVPPPEVRGLASLTKASLGDFGAGYCGFNGILPTMMWRCARLSGPDMYASDLLKLLPWAGQAKGKSLKIIDMGNHFYHVTKDNSRPGQNDRMGEEFYELLSQLVASDPDARIGSGFVFNPEATVFMPAQKVDMKTKPVWIRGEMFVPRTISDAIACTEWRNIYERNEQVVTRSGHVQWHGTDVQVRKLIARAETHRWFRENKGLTKAPGKRSAVVVSDYTWHHGRLVDRQFSGVKVIAPIQDPTIHDDQGVKIPSLNPVAQVIPRQLQSACALTARERASIKAGKPFSYIKSSIGDAVQETLRRNANRRYINADFVIAEAFYPVTQREVEFAEKKEQSKALAWIYNDNLHPDTSISACVRLSALRNVHDGDRRMFGAVRSLIANTVFIIKSSNKRMGSSLRELIPRRY